MQYFKFRFASTLLALSFCSAAQADFTPQQITQLLEANQRSDHATALRIIRPLAERGDRAAQYELGVMYYEGKGVRQSARHALNWFHKAAQQGHAISQYNIVLMYAKGLGMARDLHQAELWIRKAAEQGNQNAVRALQELQGY